MELTARRSPKVATLVLGYFILTAATLLFGVLVYVAEVGFREPIPGVSEGPLSFIRHVALVPGFLPWMIAATTWVATLHFGGRALKGLGFIAVAIPIHYTVVAISAHSDAVYPWAQSIEALFAAYCLQAMIRPIARPAPGMC